LRQGLGYLHIPTSSSYILTSALASIYPSIAILASFGSMKTYLHRVTL